MFCRILCVGIAATVAIGLATTARAETVTLRTGESVEGSVRLEGPDTVVVHARFPEPVTLEFKRNQLTPESLFAILERRTPSADAAKRRELGETAESLGLLGAAVSEYRAVAALDPSAAKDMEARVAPLLEAIAADLLEDAKDLLEEGRPKAALRMLHTLLERFPKTAAAAAVSPLMGKAHELAGASAEVARRTVDPANAGRAADAVAAHLEKGDRARAGAAGHTGAGGSADARAMLRAIDHYEDAWNGAKQFPVTETGNAELDGRLRSLHAKAKSSLVQAYVATGTVLLQRRSLPAAERYCDKACELDPENQENHELHRWIVQAKITSYPRRGGRGVR
jgi:tetratricopeptide (TPR) repeat protein